MWFYRNHINTIPTVLLRGVSEGVDEGVKKKYGERGNHYVYMEAGHAAQNLCLQAVALGYDQ